MVGCRQHLDTTGFLRLLLLKEGCFDVIRTPSTKEKVSLDDPREVLARYMAAQGLKTTRQRTLILETFFTAGGHLSVEELLELVRKSDSRISAATVYRTMRLLSDCGVAHARHFGDGQTRYELATDHHDHLICTSCGEIVEFEEEKIEELQDRIAKEHGFELTHHKMELYGLCPKCQ